MTIFFVPFTTGRADTGTAEPIVFMRRLAGDPKIDRMLHEELQRAIEHAEFRRIANQACSELQRLKEELAGLRQTGESAEERKARWHLEALEEHRARLLARRLTVNPGRPREALSVSRTGASCSRYRTLYTAN